MSLSRFGVSAVMEACSSPLSARRIFHIPNGLLVPVPWPHSIASRIIDLVKPVAPLRPDRVCRLHYQYRCLRIQLLLERLPPSLRAIPLQRLGVEEPRSARNRYCAFCSTSAMRIRRVRATLMRRKAARRQLQGSALPGLPRRRPGSVLQALLSEVGRDRTPGSRREGRRAALAWWPEAGSGCWPRQAAGEALSHVAPTAIGCRRCGRRDDGRGGPVAS
jgi:hypothetical protein